MTERVEHAGPDHPWRITECLCHLGVLDAMPKPSRKLLDRAHVGWERFIRSFPEPSHD